jgi:CubicO group peptidase (beta-lactamase class C family)
VSQPIAMLKTTFLAGLLLLTLANKKVSAQSLPAAKIKKIDSLFQQWNSTSSPGCTIGIVRNDSLIYAKGYGMSNLEYGIINTPETIFHMASVSKQFTAYSIVLLANQGKLSLDDDIRKYLPWFPDLKVKITIRNLLNHTSGIRDQWQLLAIAGTRLDDVITQEQVIKILSKQQALNFQPGEEYAYSNSGFTLLAEIVKSVTGQSIRKFTDSAIFNPLGMNHTHFHDDYMEIEKNRAYSYYRAGEGHFKNSILSYSTAGPTSLFTNIPDMSKWLMNFYDIKIGDAKTIAELTRKLKLNSGKEQSYAEGIVNDTYKGQKRYWHNGADAGYRTCIAAFPDLKMGFIVFSNLGDFDTYGKAQALEDLFIKENLPKTAKNKEAVKDSNKAILADTSAVKMIAGDYIAEDGVKFGFLLKNKKFYWDTYGTKHLLIKAQKDTFALFEDPSVKFQFTVKKNGEVTANQYWPDNLRVLTKYSADTNRTDQQLTAYTGVYYCPELDCKYGIALKGHHLWLTNSKYNDTKLTLIGQDHLTSDFWWMDHLKILRNHKNKIEGFELNSGRIRHLLFKKIE